MIDFQFDEFEMFIGRLSDAARGDFRRAFIEFLQGLGAEFLRIVEAEIIRREVMDTRLLLASFHQGNDNNVWETSEGGLTLEVGTNLNYAKFVNDGHWTVSPDTPGAITLNDGTLARFVPGVWAGDRFIYDPNANTGMMLRQQWVEGAHYWDSAVRIFEKMFPDILEGMLQNWLDKYFGM